jgi:hypothetical protein
MTDVQRNSSDNLIYLCGLHHRLVDRQEHTYTTETLLRWKREHEARVHEAVVGALPDVSFAELGVVTQAVISATAPAPDSDLTVTDPKAKMLRNGMTKASLFVLSMGLAKAREVRGFLQHMTVYDASFPDRLRGGFQMQYEKLRADGLVGDDLFDALCDFACKHTSENRLRAASLAVVAYLFEACDVFEK